MYIQVNASVHLVSVNACRPVKQLAACQVVTQSLLAGVVVAAQTGTESKCVW